MTYPYGVPWNKGTKDFFQKRKKKLQKKKRVAKRKDPELNDPYDRNVIPGAGRRI